MTELLIQRESELKVDNQRTLAQLLCGKLSDPSVKNHIAAIDAISNDRITHREILNLAIVISQQLENHGVGKNDVVVLMHENHINYAAHFLGCLLSGAIFCPLNPIYTLYELEHMFTILKPRIIISANKSGKLTQLQTAFHYTIMEFIDRINQSIHLDKSDEYLPSDVGGEDNTPIVIICSSGTTGMPKGVMHTNRSLRGALNILQDVNGLNAKPSDILLGYLPFFHLMGITTLLGCLWSRQLLVVLSKFHPQPFLASIERFQVNRLFIVPTIGLFLTQYPELHRYDLTSLHEMICAGSTLTPAVFNALRMRLSHVDIRLGYGMSELGYTTIMPSHCKSQVEKSSSVGRLLPGYSAKLVSINNENQSLLPLKTGEAGELCIKSECNFSGYFGDEASTQGVVDDDGYVHTGDLFYFDDDGFLYIVDRIKELIKHKGLQVSPAELEAILMKHPMVKDVAVVGIPDEKTGEVPRAFVVLQEPMHEKKDEKKLAVELMAYVDGFVSPFKRLSGGVVFVADIPKNPSGKILRRLLRGDRNASAYIAG